MDVNTPITWMTASKPLIGQQFQLPSGERDKKCLQNKTFLNEKLNLVSVQGHFLTLSPP